MPSLLNTPLPGGAKLDTGHVRLIVRLFLFRQTGFFRNMNSDKLRHILQGFAKQLFDHPNDMVIDEETILEAMVKEGYRAKRLTGNTSWYIFNLDPKSLNNLKKIQENLGTQYSKFEAGFEKNTFDETGKRRHHRHTHSPRVSGDL